MVIKIQEQYELIRNFDFCDENKGQSQLITENFNFNGMEEKVVKEC